MFFFVERISGTKYFSLFTGYIIEIRKKNINDITFFPLSIEKTFEARNEIESFLHESVRIHVSFPIRGWSSVCSEINSWFRLLRVVTMNLFDNETKKLEI